MGDTLQTSELDQLNEKQLRSAYCAVLADLNSQPTTLQDWKLAYAKLRDIQSAFAHRRQASL